MMTTAATGPYQHAREIALRIQERPNTSARELYRLFGEQFAQWNCDGDKAAAMISQHLAKFESDGLVIGEKSGKKANDPKVWVWVGPAPQQTEAVVEVVDQTETVPDPNTADAAIQQVPVMLNPSDPIDALLIALWNATNSMTTAKHVDRRDEKIASLKRLADIAAPDISELLLEIANDIGE